MRGVSPEGGEGAWSAGGSCGVDEIVEEENPAEARRLPAVVEEDTGDVYVAVGDDGSSMAALAWALKHASSPSSFLYLVHVFPEVHRIPTPLGKMPRNQVRPEQVESYMSRERNKRAAMLQKYLTLCSASKVKVDTILIESDLTAKAILDLIPILNVRKLVLGTTRPSLRKLKEWEGTAEQIQKNAPDFCEVKIICEGEEKSTAFSAVMAQGDSGMEEKHRDKGSSYCTCFAPNIND